MKPLFFRVAAILLCLVLATFAFSGKLDFVTRYVGSDKLQRQNEQYLDDTFNKALVGFGVMSTVKAGLAIIEGSTAGISVGATLSLQVGDVVQSAYDYVDIAWRTLLTGCITILSTKYLLKAADIIDAYVFGFTMLVLIIYLSTGWWFSRWIRIKAVLRDVLALAIVATLSILYILPISVWGASHLSQVITKPAIEEAQHGFAQTQKEFFSDDDNAVANEGVVPRLKQIPERIQRITDYLKHKSKEMAVWTIKLIVGYIFDCIVFPLALFTMLLWLTRSVMKYIFQKNLQSSLRDDLRRILAEQRTGKPE